MPRRANKLSDLKKIWNDTEFESALDYCEKGDYKEAVELLENIKDFSGLEKSEKRKVKEAYYKYGLSLQRAGKLQMSVSCFTRARAADPEDPVLTLRVSLIQGYRSYASDDNIGGFRKMVKEGFTGGKYLGQPHPFMTIAEKHSLIEAPKEELIEASSLTSYHSVGVYRTAYYGSHLLSNLIRSFKYHGGSDLSLPFAWLIADIVRYKTNLLNYIDFMVPLPSNPNKQYERGYMPCLLLAKELSACLCIPFYELFLLKPMDCRFRDMSYDEGKKLIRYQKGQSREISKGRNILLLDDVATKGRTLSLHAEKLIEDGAESVHAFTIAKTVHYS